MIVGVLEPLVDSGGIDRKERVAVSTPEPRRNIRKQYGSSCLRFDVAKPIPWDEI